MCLHAFEIYEYSFFRMDGVSVLENALVHCIVLYCISLYCTALCCVVLYMNAVEWNCLLLDLVEWDVNDHQSNKNL